LKSLPELILSVAFGEAHEPAGIIKLARTETLGVTFDLKRERWPVTFGYAVQAIERLERAGRYAAVVERVAVLAGKGKLTVLADITACGRPPVDLMLAQRLRPIPVVIGESVGARASRRTLHLPKRDLVAGLSIVMGDRRMKVMGGLEEAATLATQLERFRAVRPAGTPTALDEPDELVRALALALWWSEHRMPAQTKQPPPPRQKAEPPKPMTFDMAMKQLRRGRTAVRARL
jgi:hypothetical protein